MYMIAYSDTGPRFCLSDPKEEHQAHGCIKSPLTCYPLRLTSGQSIKSSLLRFVEENQLRSAFVLTCVGSVTKADLRMADSKTIRTYTGHYEIVSLVGTLSGGGHLHVSLSDIDSNVVGGHVFGELIVYTTAEIVIGECTAAVMTREPDQQTGYNELTVSPR